MLDDTQAPVERSRLVRGYAGSYGGSLGEENGADLESELIEPGQDKKEPSMLALVATFRMHLLAVSVYGFLGTLKAVSFFPFLR